MILYYISARITCVGTRTGYNRKLVYNNNMFTIPGYNRELVRCHNNKENLSIISLFFMGLYN